MGYPISHSLSPQIFNSFFARYQLPYQYGLLEREQLLSLQTLFEENPSLKGLNITSPYKETFLEDLDLLSPEACSIGAVNTIVAVEGSLKGYNTDALALKDIFLNLELKKNIKRILILGTGGAAKAVSWAARELSIPYRLVSRKPSNEILSYDGVDSEILSNYNLIVNATPVGMDGKSMPGIRHWGIGKDHVLLDLIYHPWSTPLMAYCSSLGCCVQNGYEMLLRQASYAWQIWRDQLDLGALPDISIDPDLPFS